MNEFWHGTGQGIPLGILLAARLARFSPAVRGTGKRTWLPSCGQPVVGAYSAA